MALPCRLSEKDDRAVAAYVKRAYEIRAKVEVSFCGGGTT
jgi:hypothetical protein